MPGFQEVKKKLKKTMVSAGLFNKLRGKLGVNNVLVI